MPDSLLAAIEFVRMIQDRQGLRIIRVDEIAFRQGIIDVGQLKRLARRRNQNAYGQYRWTGVVPAEAYEDRSMLPSAV